MTRITNLRVFDLRFPTSQTLDGSDAMNPDPDYSAAYVVLETDGSHEGHGLTFTLGRGTEVWGAAIEELPADFAGFWRRLTHESQLRWLGPEKGVIHLATGALVNAVWDLYAKLEKKPFREFLADMTPEHWVSCVDFTYLTDAITPEEAVAILK